MMNEGPILTITDSGIAYSVWFDRYDGDRCQYGYRIFDSDDPTIVFAEGDDLRSGSGARINLPDMLATLLGFLGAFLESWPDGENAVLFPAACAGIDADYVVALLAYLEEDS